MKTYFEPVYDSIVSRSAIDAAQMTAMYAKLGNSYEELLPPSSWIDEMSHSNSKQLLGRIMHLTLNGDSQLDTDYQELVITKRNFFRNLERMQKFLYDTRKIATTRLSAAGGADSKINQAAKEFMQIYLGQGSGALRQQQNLSTPPLNYALVGEHFAALMIAGEDWNFEYDCTFLGKILIFQSRKVNLFAI